MNVIFVDTSITTWRRDNSLMRKQLFLLNIQLDWLYHGGDCRTLCWFQRWRCSWIRWQLRLLDDQTFEWIFRCGTLRWGAESGHHFSVGSVIVYGAIIALYWEFCRLFKAGWAHSFSYIKALMILLLLLIFYKRNSMAIFIIVGRNDRSVFLWHIGLLNLIERRNRLFQCLLITLRNFWLYSCGLRTRSTATEILGNFIARLRWARLYTLLWLWLRRLRTSKCGRRHSLHDHSISLG